jgi:hypothetical protein
MGLKRVYRKYGRAYQDTEGNEYPGVTTILDVIDKGLDKWKMRTSLDYQREQVEAAHRGERLLDWDEIKKEAMKAPDAYRDKKGTHGTKTHKLIEDHMTRAFIDPYMERLIKIENLADKARTEAEKKQRLAKRKEKKQETERLKQACKRTFSNLSYLHHANIGKDKHKRS